MKVTGVYIDGLPGTSNSRDCVYFRSSHGSFALPLTLYFELTKETKLPQAGLEVSLLPGTNYFTVVALSQHENSAGTFNRVRFKNFELPLDLCCELAYGPSSRNLPSVGEEIGLSLELD